MTTERGTVEDARTADGILRHIIESLDAELTVSWPRPAAWGGGGGAWLTVRREGDVSLTGREIEYLTRMLGLNAAQP